jgi:hypothetical protein
MIVGRGNPFQGFAGEYGHLFVDSRTAFPNFTPVDSVIAAPVEWVESVGNLRLPRKADQRLQELIDRNNEGDLNALERAELEALVELSEQLSLIRSGALEILGKHPE